MRFANVIEVFIACQLAEFTRDGCPGLVCILAWVLLLECFHSHLFLVSFHFLREHLEQSVDYFAIVYFLHALERENSRSRILFVDLQHALDGGQWRSIE